MPRLSTSRPLSAAIALAALALGGAAFAADAPKQQLELAPANDPVVARVNGTEYHKSDLVTLQKQLPQQYQALPLESIYPQLLDQLVNNNLLADAAKQAKLADDAEVKSELARLQDRIMIKVYLDHFLKTEVTDDKLQARYQQMIKDKPAEDEIHARHILVQSEADAKAIIAKLDKGADFAKLADEKDPKNKNGGDLGYFTKAGMVPEFGEAAFKLKVGEYTKAPVKTQFGWHVIKVEDRRPAKPAAFDEVKEQVAQVVEQEAVQDKVKDLRSKGKVEEFNLDGTPLAAAAPDKAAPAKPAAK